MAITSELAEWERWVNETLKAELWIPSGRVMVEGGGKSEQASSG